jgi:hypothetical protein
MSADELRRAAESLRERAIAATPGEWIAFGQAIGVTVRGCTCAGTAPGYPQHESYCGTDGPIIDGSEPDITYVATVQPTVGLALADWLDSQADHIASHDCEAHCAYPDGCPQTRHASQVARLINGGAR